MRKKIDRVFTVFVFRVMECRHSTCDHFVALSLYERGHSRFNFKNTVGQISIFCKSFHKIDCCDCFLQIVFKHEDNSMPDLSLLFGAVQSEKRGLIEKA